MRHPIYGIGTVALLALAVLFLGPETGAGAQDRGAAGRAGDAVVGASVAVPEGWSVERERYTLDGTYGFTLWQPQADEVAQDHGGEPGVRVSLAPDLEPEEIGGKVRNRLAELGDVPAKRETVRVGEGNYKGVAVGPIPGSTPSTEVYMAADGRVYQINVYGERLDAAAKKLLSTLKFDDPSRSVASLRLPDGESSAAFAREDGELLEREEAAREEALAPEGARTTSAASTVPVAKEKKIAEGCWTAASGFFFQTQHGYGANALADDPGTDAPKGYSVIGEPNFWGQYTHGNLNYGRCVSTYYVNDKFAIDYPLNQGDVVFSPFQGGTVTFAGRNNSHKNFGIFVTIRADNGKYVSMSAHLSALASGIRPGARVTDATVIGFAGNTGDPSIPVGEVHLHQAFYRYPKYLADGSPYGGAGLQAVYHHYAGTAAGTGPGVYKFGWERSSTTKSQGDLISN